MDIDKTEIELKKRVNSNIPYKWYQEQTDEWDKETNFIFDITEFDNIIVRLKKEGFEEGNEKFGYALNRWYSNWSQKAINTLFADIDNVEPIKNSRDRIIGIQINSISFKVHISVYPREYGQTLENARGNPRDLIEWLYEKESKGQRLSYDHKLYIIVYKTDGDHWKLKSELQWLKEIIVDYISSYDEDKLHSVKVDPNSPDKETLSDIIWAIED